MNSELAFRFKSHGAFYPLGPLLRDRIPFPEVERYPKETAGTAFWLCVLRLGDNMQTENR